MMAYFSESQLRSAASSYSMKKTASAHLLEAKASSKISIFLSHSSKDRILAQGFVITLGNLGYDVYVDWNDSEMPRVTDKRTASILKERIDENSLFIVLATRNAMASKWVPWEIGIADQMKGENSLLVVPVSHPNEGYYGSEYMALYKRIVISDSRKAFVFDVGKNQDGSSLDNYMRIYG
ncbi:MAG: TIR domain-containing protein [Blastochloris sp.]|nr:TIR domain-containing protein [Blastochloris sp.]